MTGNQGELQVGRRVGKYEILTRLSVGGMAELFLAFSPGPGGFKKFVALKQILPDVRADESFVAMFLDEARLTAGLAHPNVAQVFDLGEDEQSGELYLAMEFVSGQNLEQIVKRAAKRQVAIPVGFAARVVRDTCLALHSAHAFTEPGTGKPNPIVHRDVSPKNVMVTYAGAVKIIDFGIAKARGRLNRTQVGIVKGTSGYMAPEQLRNEPLDGRSDLFAVAVMLHELLTGERLYSSAGQSDAAVMIQIIDAVPKNPKTVNPRLSDALCALVLKGLAKKREQRYPTGKDFARALEQACPELYDDEQTAKYMAKLFDDKIETTRQLFEMANQNTADEASMTNAVRVLSEEPEPNQVRLKGAATPMPRAPSLATPKPSAKPPSPSKKDLGGVRDSKEQPARPRSPSVPAMPPSPSGRQVKVAEPFETRRAPPKPSEREDAPVPATVEMGPDEKPGKSTWKVLAIPAALAVLVLLGLAFALGPLKGLPGAAKQAFTKFFAAEDAPEPDTSAKPITDAPDPNADKPQWLKDKFDQSAQLKAEKQAQAEIEAAANDPERQRVLKAIQEQLSQLDRLEREQASLRAETRAGSSASGRKIEELQKQIDELRGLLGTNRKKAGLGAAPGEGEVQVITDDKGAKAAALGFLSLRTLGPQETTVSEQGGGSWPTPMAKVPFAEGTHRLTVLDGDGKPRLLVVKIAAGQTLELKGVFVDSLPLLP